MLSASPIKCLASQAAKGEKIVGAAKSKSVRNFSPARFKSIIFGQSNEQALIRAFGQPLAAGLGTDRIKYLKYRDIWLVPGDVEFSVEPKSGLVMGMSVTLLNSDIDTVTGLLGSEFVISRFDLIPDPENDDGDSSVAYRHPKGMYRVFEYPDRGIVIPLFGSSHINIIYMSIPFGVHKDPRKGR